MDDLKLLLQAIVNISNECIDLDAQKKLDELYDWAVDKMVSCQKAMRYGAAGKNSQKGVRV